MIAYARSWLQRAGLLESAVLTTLLILGLSIWGFIEVADEVLEGESQQFDERAIAMMRRDGMPIGPPWLANVARDLTALGSGTIVGLVTAAAAGFLALRGKWGAFCLVIGSIAGGAILSTLMKRGFDRPRPDQSMHLDVVTSLSFPSGHSMLAAVTYFTLGALLARTTSDRRIKAYFLTIAVLLAVTIGITRIYLGVHFPTDVLAGWCAGIAWALVCSLLARWLQRQGTIEKESPAPAAASLEAD
jgi:undecaprenyl-diphosphatase